MFSKTSEYLKAEIESKKYFLIFIRSLCNYFHGWIYNDDCSRYTYTYNANEYFNVRMKKIIKIKVSV